MTNGTNKQVITPTQSQAAAAILSTIFLAIREKHS
jgi:hypothetical protein